MIIFASKGIVNVLISNKYYSKIKIMKFLSKGFYLVCMLVFAMGITACSDDDKDGDTPPPPSPLTPDEHKAKLETVGKDFVAKFNAEDHRAAVEAIDYLNSIIDPLIGSDDEDVILPPDPGYDPNPYGKMLASLRSVAKDNSLNGLVTLATEVDEYGLSDLEGVYSYDNKTEKWDTTAATGKIELVFDNGKACVLTVTFEGGKDYTYENTVVNVPAKVNISLKVAGAEQIGATINTNLANDQKSAEVSAKMTLNGGYVWELAVNAKSNAITQVSKMTKNGETLISSNAEITGTNLTDPDALQNNEPEDLVSNGALDFTVMGDIAMSGKANIKSIIREVDLITEPSDSKTGAQKEAEIYNKYASLAMYYSGGSEKVADIKMDIVKDEDDYDHNIGYQPEIGKKDQSVITEYYYAAPVLIFASDGSKYDMETYFSDANFGSLIESVRTLANKYAAMIGETVDF